LVGQYLRKGSPVLLEGRLRLDQWDDKATGQKRSKLVVVAEDVRFLGTGNREEGAGGGAPRPAASKVSAPPAAAEGEPEGAAPEEDDVPF
jgi:single-strand DNA-binding protein